MKKVFYILVVFIVFASCGDFQKAMKSEDTAEQFKLGTQLFEEEKWSKANRLFEVIVPKYRGKPQAEKLMFMDAMCLYKLERYSFSSYKFEQFVTSYPKSEKAQEAAYLSLKSYYEESPTFSRDSEETIKAIEKSQLFIDAYPESEYLPKANKLISALDFKLEKKAFETAKQYNHIFQYKASIKSFNNFLFDFPGSTLREDALFYKFDSEYELAILSIDKLKEERIEIALADYSVFVKLYPNSKYLDLANEQKANLEAAKDITKS
jgi:outer membrane protein assembly factor BamD